MIKPDKATMRRLDMGCRSFFVLAEASRLLGIAHDEQREWHSEIKASAADGYEVHIVIHPPKKMKPIRSRKKPLATH